MPSPLPAGTFRGVAIRCLPLIALGALAAGCGGPAHAGSASTTSTSAPAGTGPAPASASASAARARFVSCLEAHGVPASEATRGFGGRRGAPPSGSSAPSTPGSTPTGGPVAPSTPPTTSAAFAAAFQACRSELPAGAGPGNFRNSAAGRAYLQCLQLHGVTIPSTPSGSTATGGFGGLAANPNFQAARTACAALAPARSGPDATSSTSSAA